jgi:hypothetical protein
MGHTSKFFSVSTDVSGYWRSHALQKHNAGQLRATRQQRQCSLIGLTSSSVETAANRSLGFS